MKDYNYSWFSKYYDLIEKSESIENLNNILDSFFKVNNVKSVLDMTCGTGVQSIFLHKNNYDVTASDLNPEMLNIAKSKYSEMEFHQANMIDVNFNKKFDAIISIFNAIGHLSRSDFDKTLVNAFENLNDNGFYIFDIFNFDFMLENFISHEFIDGFKEFEGTKFIRFNNNRLDTINKIMKLNQTVLIEVGMDEIEKFEESWDMQIYSSDELKQIVENKGFKVINMLNIDGEKFDKWKSLSIVIFAKKQ